MDRFQGFRELRPGERIFGSKGSLIPFIRNTPNPRSSGKIDHGEPIDLTPDFSATVR
jgi:hypothetical protein